MCYITVNTVSIGTAVIISTAFQSFNMIRLTIGHFHRSIHSNTNALTPEKSTTCAPPSLYCFQFWSHSLRVRRLSCRYVHFFS